MNGLNDNEVILSREKYGNNEIKVLKKESFFKLFLSSLEDPIIKILLVALLIKTVFLFRDFDWYETIGIVVAVGVAALISSISEFGSSRAFEKLMVESSKVKCRVIRNGKMVEVLIEDVVVGDVMVLSAGDKIGADGVVINGNLEVDESYD